jgi:hypothetical protein
MPAFEHAAFISYRHGPGQIKQRFIEEFNRALSGELELLRNEKVYVDMARLKGGDLYNEALARALYQSATLVMVYQPNYFDVSHPYCAREYRAMRALEQERLSLVPDIQEREHGLIIPVVLRGRPSLPAELANHRQYQDFSKFMLMDDEISRHPMYSPKVREIAEYIHGRCQCLDDAGVPFDKLDGFELPHEHETREWIQGLNLPRLGFPGTSEV